MTLSGAPQLRTLACVKKLKLLFLSVATLVAIDCRAATIWREGEDATESSMHRHPSWYDQVKKEILSNNGWISNWGAQPGEAAYAIEVQEDGEYIFWVRANPVKSALSYAIDGDAYLPIDLQRELRGQQNIAADNKPDLRFIAWIKVGKMRLAKGQHTVRFKIHSAHENHGGIDCFVFTTENFVPQGTTKPDRANEPAMPDTWFPLIVDDDTFSPESVIDMSRLIPAPAGARGFLKADGDKLRFEKETTPAKLWGVNGALDQGRYTRDQLSQRARYLRKFGVNTVRQHPLWDEITSDGAIDPVKLDAYDWWFAELKRHGIYSTWSVFYHWKIGPGAGYPLYDDLPSDGSSPLRDTYGVIAASPELWELRNARLAELLAHRNPYTGLRYADDPALAVVEMNNEESIFFWNPLGELASESPKKWPRHAQALRAMWANWVSNRYKTNEALAAAWGPLRHGDGVQKPELKLMGPWEIDGDGIRGAFSGQTRRAGDCVRFLAEMQRANFEKCERMIRATGFRAVTITTGWVAGSGPLDPANIWSDTVGSMIDRHDYFGGGEGRHGIVEGGVKWQSHLSRPGMGLLGNNLKVVAAKPFSLSEWTQSPPNRWKLEAAPLIAFYAMGLLGWDASWHFAQAGTRLGDGWPNLSAYASDTSHFIGQFPALAFALHRGHITEAPVVVARHLAIDAIFSGRDPLRRDFSRGRHPPSANGTPAETAAIGRVTLAYGDDQSSQEDLARFWDTREKTIRSATGELIWEYGRERILVQSAKTQAIIGKPGDDEIVLPGVTARIKTAFVSVIFTPLDDLPLNKSRRILITALGQDRQSGARYNADGTRLEAVGTAPLLLEPVQATFRLQGDAPSGVRPLDHYGVPNGKDVAIGADGSVTIDGRFGAYYYEVRR